MRMSKNKLAFIKNNARRFTVINSLVTGKNKAPVIGDITTIEQVFNIVDSVRFFKSLGGKETVRCETDGNGNYSLITINCLSVSPDRSDWSNRNMVLMCDSDTLYTLINLR